MRREEFADLATFAVVAEERSFTRAAARLGLSQSAVSQIVRRLEERLGLRLLARTTRSVAPTESGERLVATLAPMLRELDQSMASLSEFRDRPAGTIRLTATEHAARRVLGPALARLLPGYPDIAVEVVIDYGLTDIVADRFDAGVRIGEQVDKDMIAVRIGPDIAMAVVGAPAHFARHGRPAAPEELVRHPCLNLRLGLGTFYRWTFRRKGQTLRVRVEGPLAFNSIYPIREAALDGLGLACLPLDEVAQDLAEGRLERVLERWTAPLPGYRLYYPSRCFPSPAFALVVDALRHRPR